MTTAIRKLVPDWYIPKSAKDAQPPTRFQIKPLTGIQFLEVGEVMGFSRVQATSLTLQYCLVGWEHFNDKDGAAVEFSPNMAENIARLQPDDISDLSREIMSRSKFGSDERKN